MNAFVPDAAGASSYALELPGQAPFNSEIWLKYFEENKKLRSAVRLPEHVQISEQLRAPLLKSLQKFQIGETGEGRHLRHFAKKTRDASYIQCIDLFVKEEQSHGQMLAEVIASVDGRVLSWHWTDLVFICLRRMFGLKTEIFILLIAEVIGKCFYRVLADSIGNQQLSNVFAFIVCDEIAHLRFHSEFLNQQMQNYSWPLKCFIHYAWSLIFYTACFVFILDHKNTLTELKIPTADFMASCSKEFQRSARCAFGLQY